MEFKPKILKFLGFSVVLATVFLIPNVVQASFSRSPEVKIYNSDNLNLQNIFLAFEKEFKGGSSVGIGDLGQDGTEEIIVGAGPGGGPQVKVFRADGSLISSFMAYDEAFNKGVNVAIGDLNGDGQGEIITGTRLGKTHVRVFNVKGQPVLIPGFFAYGDSFRGGVNVAVGDINGDGKDEIITGSGPGGSHVRVFNQKGEWMGLDFWPFSSEYKGGISVATGNVDGGLEDEIIMGVYCYGKAWVKVYKADSQKTVLGEFQTFPDSFLGGVNVASGDIDQDGYDEVIVGANIGGGPHLRTFEAYGKEIAKNFFAYEDDFRGGVFVALGDIDNDNIEEIITTPNRRVAEGRRDLYKYIEVDISEQRIFLYENGFLVDSYLIASGLPGFPTPLGTFKVYKKRLSVRMSWYYGPGSRYNYDLPGVPWVLSFQGPYTLHGTYWHNNFGHRRSHGCVNLPTPKAKWMYDWAPIGTPVIVHN